MVLEASAKQTALGIIERLPDGASLDDILYELYFRARIERGMEELRQGRVVSNEEVKQETREWLESLGL